MLLAISSPKGLQHIKCFRARLLSAQQQPRSCDRRVVRTSFGFNNGIWTTSGPSRCTCTDIGVDLRKPPDQGEYRKKNKANKLSSLSSLAPPSSRRKHEEQNQLFVMIIHVQPTNIYSLVKKLGAQKKTHSLLMFPRFHVNPPRIHAQFC